ncbi:DCC1-like thiol-disulfide oxidoreductase family protein [Streptomyces sp. NPDC048568]
MRARRRSPVPVAVQFRRLRAVGTVDAGPDAVGKLLLSAAGAWSPLGAALLVPVARSAAHVLYRLVADNRSRLPGRSGACAVPEPRSA